MNKSLESVQVVDLGEASASLIKRSGLTASNDSTQRTVIDFGLDATLTTGTLDDGASAGPSPVTALVGALSGCVAATFNRTATEFDLTYRGITFDSEYRMDAASRTGLANAATQIHTIRIEARVSTDAPLDALARVVEETERRCPISNLIRDAGVQLKSRWIRESAVGPAAR